MNKWWGSKKIVDLIYFSDYVWGDLVGLLLKQGW